MRLFLLALFLVPALAFADGWQTAPGVGTPRANTTPGVPMERANVNRYGNVQVTTVGADGTQGADTRRSTATVSNPSVANITSVTVLAANTSRNGFRIQNNSAANVCCSVSGAPLTGIAPSATNNCEVLAAGASLSSLANVVNTSAITCYQSSGGAINTITVVEW